MTAFTEDTMLARYKELCAKRDSVYAKQKPLEDKLAAKVSEIEKARLEAEAISKEIDKDFGQEWFALKKEIALLARTLSRPNGPLASYK